MRYPPDALLIDADGTHRRPNIRIALIGPRMVDAAWAVNALTVQTPLNGRGAFAVYESAREAEAAWMDAPSAPDLSDFLLCWPAGQGLRWNALIEAVKHNAEVVRIGEATVYGRRGKGTVALDDLACDVAPLATTRGTQEARPVADVSPDRCILHAVPTLGQVSLRWVAHACALHLPIAAYGYFAVVQGYEVGEARERIASLALSAQPRPAWVFWHGDDMLPGVTDLAQLMVLARDLKLPAVSALYACKQDAPEEFVAWRKGLPTTLRPNGVDFNAGDVVEVSGCGLDFCVMRTDMLAVVEAPRFKTRQSLADGRLRLYGEDAHFWFKWRKGGGRGPFVATGVRVGHYDAASGKVY